MTQHELIPHLFRSEFQKIVAVLVKRFGLEHIEAAEDIAGETFLAALDLWTYKGIPENPVAWLYRVANNKAINYLRRRETFLNQVSKEVREHQPAADEIDLSEQNILDSRLQMMFAVCHPSIPQDAQIGLALRILCGFGIDEVARAFLTNKEVINKRLFRAREKLRNSSLKMELPPEGEMLQRTKTILTMLYLLFNEGYYSESNDAVLREDLCLEAMRLTHLLIENPTTNVPQVHALLALMCFHSSRFPARKSPTNGLILYHDQDELLWDQALIARGAYHLNQSAEGNSISHYHVEASIAYWHTQKEDTLDKWKNILRLYDILLSIQYSPVAALNRIFALSKVKGKPIAIAELEKLQLTDNPYYYTLLGELYTGIDTIKATSNFSTALALARTTGDRELLSKKLEELSSPCK